MKKQIMFSLLICLILVSMFDIVSAGGGCAVPVSTIDLTEQGTDYSMKPGRLKFEFDEKMYAIQLRRVEQDYVTFLIMTLDMNKPDDITAYTLDNSFNLSTGEKKEIDLDKNGINDIFIGLNEIISTGKYNSIRSTDFSIKKINTKKSETLLSNEGINAEVINPNEIIKSEVQEPILEPVIILNPPDKKLGEIQLTFSDKIINWFKGLFE